MSADYTRIIGELKKLGIIPPSRNTIKRILKKSGWNQARGEVMVRGTSS
jgi:hypothetical protein